MIEIIPDRVWLAMRQTTYVCALALGFGIGFATCMGCGFAPAASASDAPDAGVSDDDSSLPMPDAPDASSAPDATTLTPIVLRETASDAVTPGSSVVCYASGAQSTLDGTWYRVFRLSDFGISSSLVIDRVAFAPDHALNAQGANAVQVKIGTYTGAIGGTTISTGSIAIVATASVDIPNNESPQAVIVPIAATISSGAFVVEIAAPSLQGVGHFNLGATTSAETTPGYFGTIACSISPPKSLAALGVSGHVVLDVGGAW